MKLMAAARPCRCTHDRDAHRHYRRGTICGSCACPWFRRPRRIRRDLLGLAAGYAVIGAILALVVTHCQAGVP